MWWGSKYKEVKCEENYRFKRISSENDPALTVFVERGFYRDKVYEAAKQAKREIA